MVYEDLTFPDPTPDRPYIAINMVATIDGKTVIHDRDSSVKGLGSKVDYETLRAIETACDAVIIGAQTVRATPKAWFPHPLKRFVVTNSGRVPAENRIIADYPNDCWIVTHEAASIEVGLQSIRFGENEVDWSKTLKWIRNELDVRTMVCEGGATLNGSLLAGDFVDEIFLTIAPKVKSGIGVPTMVEGVAFDGNDLPRFELLSVKTVDSELFLRYRRIAA